MAGTDLEEGKTTSVPTNDAWTGMLAVSLLALLVASVLLFLDWQQYGKVDRMPMPTPVLQEPPPIEKEPAPEGKGEPMPMDGAPKADGKKGP